MNRINTQEKCNILVLSHGIEKSNGGVQSMIDLIEQLEQKPNIKFIVAFWERNGTAKEYLKKKGIQTAFLPFLRWDHQKGQSIRQNVKTVPNILFHYNYLLALGCWKFIKDNNINIIYTNTFTIGFGCILSHMYHIPHIWHIREFGWEDHRMRIIFGEKLMYTWMEKYTDRLIVISQSLKKKYEQYISEKKISVLYDDVSANYYQEKSENFFREKTVRLLIAGTLQPGKGQLEAVEAVSDVIKRGYDVELFIAGTGNMEYLRLIQKKIACAKLEKKIHILGQVSDMNRLRKDMHGALVCSKSEAFGRVTIEAMLSELFVIGADAAGTSELISDNLTGLLYKPGDTKMLADKIIDLVKNRDRMREISLEGQRYAVNTFTVGNCSKGMEKIFTDIISR